MGETEWAEGGCHCGAVRFRVRIARPELLRCNCSFCRLRADLQLIVDPVDFELLSGEGDLATYRFGSGQARHRFCRHCGIHPFNRPRSHPDSLAVNARCLDGDRLAAFRVIDFDGRNWEDSIEALRDREVV